MTRIFEDYNLETTNPVALKVINGSSPLTVAAGLINWLEDSGAEMKDPTWGFQAHSNILDAGVSMKFESVDLTITCNDESVLFAHVSGEKTNFWALCKLFSETEA